MYRIFQIYRESFLGLPRLAWMLALALLINRSGSMVLFFLTIYLTSQLQFSVSAAGSMISIYGLGALVGAFWGGWLSDRFGPRRIQIYTLLFSGILYIVLGYIRDPLLFALLLFILAINTDAFRPANSTAMADACPPAIRVRGFVLNRLAINLGLTIGPAVGGWLATIDYIYLFWIDGLTTLLAIVILVRYTRATGIPEHPLVSERSSQPVMPWKDTVFLTVLILAFLLGLVFVQLFNTWPVYLRSVYRLLEDKIGLLLALNAVMIVLIEMPLVYKLEKWNGIKIMQIGSVLFLSGFIILPFGNTFAYAVGTVFLFTWGEMLVFPLMAGFIANRAPDRTLGKYMGMYTFTFALCYVIGPFIGTRVYEHYGAQVLWTGCGLIIIPVFFAFRYLRKQIENKEKQG